MNLYLLTDYPKQYKQMDPLFAWLEDQDWKLGVTLTEREFNKRLSPKCYECTFDFKDIPGFKRARYENGKYVEIINCQMNSGDILFVPEIVYPREDIVYKTYLLI